MYAGGGGGGSGGLCDGDIHMKHEIILCVHIKNCYAITQQQAS